VAGPLPPTRTGGVHQRTPPRDGSTAAVFDALADPTRRRLLETVARQGPVTATSLAASATISRQAISKHLGVLEAAGVLRADRVGREVRFGVVPGALEGAAHWMAEVGAAWDDRLGRLRRHLAES
jgi:DNA-binding transcriptional ArsR family regulator